jgi:hypothetical protein
MSNLKNKVSETAQHMRNAVTEAVEKVSHAAIQAFHKADHALADPARKAVGVGVETIAESKEVGNLTAREPQSATPAAADKDKVPGDKAK